MSRRRPEGSERGARRPPEPTRPAGAHRSAATDTPGAVGGPGPQEGCMADTSDDVQAVLDAEDRRYRAMVEGDLVALDALLAPGMSYAHSSGRRESKDEYLGRLRSGY